jgi:simple sugar transport system substrate-binding protein
MKHTIKLLTATLIATSAVAGPAWTQTHEVTVAMVTHGQASDPFWAIVKRGAEDAARQAGVKFEYRAPETFDMTQMANLISSAAARHPDGLIVSTPDVDALSAPLHAAEAAGITVITINGSNAASRKLGAVLNVGQAEEEAGRAAGARFAAIGGKKGVCINHEVGNVNLDARCHGFAEGFGHPVQILPTAMDPSETASKLRALLQSDTQIDSVLSLNAPVTGDPAVQVVKALGRTSSVHVAAFDLGAEFLRAVAAGEAAFAVDQQPYLQGYIPVSFLALHARYGMMPASDVASGPNLVTKEQANRVIELAQSGIR